METNKKILGLEMNLDQEYIKGAVEDIVKAGIVQALGNPEEIVRAAISQSIAKKVDRDGKPSTSYDAKPYLDWLANRTVEQTVRDCIVQWIEENKQSLETEIKKQLGSKKFKEQTAASFIKTMLDSANSHYTMPLYIRFEEPKRY